MYKSKIIPISSPNLRIKKKKRKERRRRRRESLSHAQKVLPLFRNKLLPNRLLVPKSGYICMCVYILTDNVFITHSVTTLCVCVYICDEMKKNPCMICATRKRRSKKQRKKKERNFFFFFFKKHTCRKETNTHTPHTDKKREKKETHHQRLRGSKERFTEQSF